MGGGPATTVLLSTVRWTPVVDELADQLGPDDEVIVVCDSHDDPVARDSDDFPADVRLVVAGDPEGCSGKANAVAAGLEAARNDRIVWTDDDFHHPPDWLATLNEDYDEHGPVSEIPFFVGRDALSTLLEPQYALSNVFGLYAGNQPWGGAVMFERDDLDFDGLVADLRRTVSDDGLLGDFTDFTCVRRVRRVEIGGTIDEAVERHVRFVQIVHHQVPWWFGVGWIGGHLLAAIGALWLPLFAFAFWTLLTAGVYAFVGARRWTVVLAYPSIVVYPLLLLYGLVRPTFVWGGRRYRYASKFDVEIVEST